MKTKVVIEFSILKCLLKLCLHPCIQLAHEYGEIASYNCNSSKMQNIGTAHAAFLHLPVLFLSGYVPGDLTVTERDGQTRTGSRGRGPCGASLPLGPNAPSKRLTRRRSRDFPPRPFRSAQATPLNQVDAAGILGYAGTWL